MVKVDIEIVLGYLLIRRSVFIIILPTILKENLQYKQFFDISTRLNLEKML